MAFAIVAEFVLGTYRARQRDGSLDPLPSPARMHSALLAAAGSGVRARDTQGGLSPAEADRRALSWLETHPPDGIRLPEHAVNPALVTAYRAEGFSGVRKGGRRLLETRADRQGSVAFSGPIAWVWDERPPEDVVEALAVLCADVPYLGTSDSPVRLTIAETEPTHRLDRSAGLFSRRGIDLEIPLDGRTATLEGVYQEDARRPPPSAAGDRPAKAESALIDKPPLGSLGQARYVPADAVEADAPWTTVVLLGSDRYIRPQSRVAWCVALHRALVARIGDGAPALVTGKYEEGVTQPPNRLAIQYLPPSVPAPLAPEGAGAFALLLPVGADTDDLAVLDRALRDLKEIRLGAHGIIRFVGAMRVVPGDAFWDPVAPASERVWVTAIPAIPESRPVRGQPWTLEHALLLSLGMVFRTRFPRSGARADWYRDLVAQVAGLGVQTIEAHKLNGGDIRRWVHHIRVEAAVQPYRAALKLGSLAGERTILAIGQTRHLGGGMLTPLDIPMATPSPERERTWR